ncbi:MAG TPA: hypothetical protein VKB73_13445 [Gaiellaceae bacterium]|nr:hypothetical protein [Gaiellaceae bacterium]
MARARRVLYPAVVSIVAAGWAAVALAAGGELDSSFSGDGWVRTLEVRSPTNNYLPRGGEDVALQPDGKVLVTGEILDGTSHWYFGVFRYTADGSLDRTFAEGGFAEIDLGEAEFAHAVAVQRNGRIVVAGEADCPFAICFALVRFLPDGRLDRSFGANGVVRTMFARYGASRAYDAVQPDGKIVVVGMRFRGDDAQDDELFAVARYLPDGRLDRSFSRDGLASVDFGFGDSDAAAVALRPGGKILVAGNGARNVYRTGEDFAVARFRADGRLDRSFSRDGRATVDFGHRLSDSVRGLALLRDGRIVLAGSSGKRGTAPRIAVARLRANGRLDRTFGGGGKRLTRPGPHGGYADAVVRQPDGRIVVAGGVFDDNRLDTSAWVLARYGHGGAVDPSFGHRGLVVSAFSTGADWVGELAVQRNGRIVAAGSVGESQALARYRAG